MRQALKLHPDSLCSAVTRIEVDVARPRAGSLVLSYVVTGTIGDLRMPPVVTAARTDELWQHTCFEAFVRRSADAAYYEFNFAPSTQWAAYRFDGYRSGMRVASEIERAPDRSAIERPSATHCRPRWSWIGCRACRVMLAWRLGLSAVIEETSGRKSYWALAHPPGKPDFHHADCFAHELSPA